LINPRGAHRKVIRGQPIYPERQLTTQISGSLGSGAMAKPQFLFIVEVRGVFLLLALARSRSVSVQAG
jgi:hypothetical protein